jgi:MFS family permease
MSLRQSDAGGDAASVERYGGIVFLMGLCQLVLTTDFSIVSVALPSIGRDLQISPVLMSWVVSATVLAFAGFLVLGGRLTDLLGQRRCLFAGLVLFAAGSLLSALSVSIWMLLPARALEGLGAALLSPSSFSLINTLVPDGAPRHRALGVFGMMQGMSVIIGLVAGGFLTTTFGWRTVFLLNMPFIAFAFGLVWRLVPRASRQGVKTFANLPSAALITVATAMLLWAVSLIGENGIRSSAGGTALLLALAGYGAFYILESRIKLPLVPRSVFTPHLIVGCVAGLGLLAGVGGIFLLANLYMQTVLGYSAAASGLGMLPYAIAVVMAGQAVPFILARMPLKAAAILGFCVNITGLLLLAAFAASQNYVMAILLGSIIAPLGSLVGYMALIGQATGGIPASQQGLASAVLFTCQQIGVAVGGTACLSVAAASTSQTAGALNAASFQAGYAAAAGLAALGLVAVAIPLRRGRRIMSA